MPAPRCDWPVRGRFDLTRSIGFGFGGRLPSARRHDAPRLRPRRVRRARRRRGHPAGRPTWSGSRSSATSTRERAAAQAARVLSLDEDATGYDRMVDRDPLLRAAYAERPGLRPPLFHSAYEALVWAVLSARRPAGQMREVRDRLSRAHGRVLHVAGEELAALPTPEQLLAVPQLPGHPGGEAAPHARDRLGGPRGEARHRGPADARPGRGVGRAAEASRGSGRSTPSWSRRARSATPTCSRSASPGCWQRRPPASAAPRSPRRTSRRSRRPGDRGGPGPASPSARPPDPAPWVVRLTGH